MGKLTYSAEQQKVLSLHKYVKRCHNKQIVFTREFKEFAIRQYELGKPPSKIFEEAQFGVDVFEHDYTRHRIKSWRVKAKQLGWDALGNDKRGRKKKSKQAKQSEIDNFAKLSDREKIEALELKVKYLEKEKDFLVKRRALMGLK